MSVIVPPSSGSEAPQFVKDFLAAVNYPLSLLIVSLASFAQAGLKLQP
jgi:hypothetical protein